MFTWLWQRTYLKGTIKYGLVYARDQMICLQRYDDSDWVGSATNRKSTPACCRKRTSVSLSATKDEYIAAEKKEREDPSSDMIQKNYTNEDKLSYSYPFQHWIRRDALVGHTYSTPIHNSI